MENKLGKIIPKKKEWLLILLAGVLLVVIAIPTKSKEIQSGDLEEQLEETLENMKQVGNVHVMITYREDERIEGVVVLAEGATNPVVVREITEVVQALFPVDAHKIKVIEHIQSN